MIMCSLFIWLSDTRQKKHGIRGSEIPLQKQDNGNGSCYKEAGEEK